MGFVLDTILIKDLVIVNTPVNVDFATDPVDLKFREAEFGIQVNYDSGTNVDMNLFLEVSLDGVNYSRINDSLQNITDASGTHIWSTGGEGSSFLRVGIEVVAGSINVNRISVHMKRRH